MSSKYLSFLENVVEQDVEELNLAEKSYGDSWKKRGGVGAFMMLARKWDRLENQCSKKGFDIFEAVLSDPQGMATVDGVLDDIQDLRRYLVLVEAELLALSDGPPSHG